MLWRGYGRVPIAATAADLLYGRLFEIAPHVRPMFPEDLTEGSRPHAGYGVKAQHYVSVESALLWTLEKGLGTAFTPEVKDAWASAYILLWTTMTDAANEKLWRRDRARFGDKLGVKYWFGPAVRGKAYCWPTMSPLRRPSRTVRRLSPIPHGSGMTR